MHVAVKPAANFMPPWRCGPTFYLLRAIRTEGRIYDDYI
jgi:hypothetical protein